MADIEPWSIKGELMLSCNCTVFCPCVISLGEHPPTEGHCQGWAGIRIDEGRYGGADLAGLNIGLLLDIPGRMSRGNWTAGVYVDERADDDQLDGLSRIFSGQARGTTHLLSILVGNFLGVHKAPIDYSVKGETRSFTIPRVIEGEIAPIAGKAGEDGDGTRIVNSQYWIAPEIVVSQAARSRVRAFGRNWDFSGRSAELCRLDWAGP